MLKPLFFLDRLPGSLVSGIYGPAQATDACSSPLHAIITDFSCFMKNIPIFATLVLKHLF